MPGSSPDLSEFFKLSRPKKKPCKVAWIFTQLDKKSKEELEAALDTDKNIITASAITEWCSSKGFEVTISMITSHRRRTCSCHG